MDYEDINFEKDMEIDPHSLDLELLNHSKIATKYISIAKQYSKIAKRAYEKVKTIRSELTLEAAAEGITYKGTTVKATTQTIEAYYRNHPSYKKAVKDMLNKQHEAEVLESIVFTIKDRKECLSELQHLMFQEYFSTPKEPRDITRKFNKRVRTVASKLKKEKKNGKKK